MGRFEAPLTQKGLPGTSGSVRDTTDPTIGAGVIGQAAARLGTEVKNLGIRFDLIQAKSQLSDSMVHASNLTNSFFDTLGSNEDPETYGEELRKLNKQIEGVTPENSRAAGVFRQNMATRSLQTAKLVRTAAEKKVEQKSQTSDFLLLQTAKTSGLEADFDVYEKAVINGVKLGVYDAKEGELLLDNADKDRDIAEKNEVFTRASSQRDEEGIMDVDRALAHVDAWDGPENDKADIRNQIQNKAAQEQKRSDEALANRTGEEDERLNQLLIDNQLSDQEIELVDLGARGKQKTFEDGWKDGWKKRLRDDLKLGTQKPWPLVDNDTAVQDLETKLTEQSSGSTDINETYKFINDAAAKGLLTKGTRDKMRSDAKKGGLDAIDEQVNASTLRVKNALIGRLTAREARFRVIEASRAFSREEQQQARATGFLLQVGFEQLNRFSAELNKRMRETGKQTLSSVEVESLAAQVWTKYKAKDDATKIREFMEFTGQRSPRPDAFPESKWNSVSDVTRASIIAGMADGMTVEQVEAMIAK
jgi:hypothetical protein